MRSSVLFVTPAHRRYELTRICLEQRQWVTERLDSEHGIVAGTVVIADDENLDIARETGCWTIERDNGSLGARFNDGHELAIDQHYEFVFPIGSDSWIDPDLVADLVLHRARRNVVRCSSWYTVIHASGSRRVTIRVVEGFGVGFCIPTFVVAQAGGRPCVEALRRGCDTSTMRGLRTATPDLAFEFVDRHPLEYVAFQSGRTQITSFDKLKTRHRGAVVRRAPLDELADHYPIRLVERIADYYASKRAAIA